MLRQIISSTPEVVYTTNRNIFKTMDTYSVIRQMRDYNRVLTNDKLSEQERKGFVFGLGLCTEEFNTRFGIKTKGTEPNEYNAMRAEILTLKEAYDKL